MAVRQTLCGRSSGSERFQILLAFAKKLTYLPEAVTSEDRPLFQSAGVKSAAIAQGILIVVGFNLINRIADALHFEPPGKNDSFAGADFLRRFGYRYLAGLNLPFRNTPSIRVVDPAQSSREGGNNAALVDSTERWLRFLVSLGLRAQQTAPDDAMRVWRKVLDYPTSTTPDDATALDRHGCTQADVFNLVLGAASAAALLRLEAGRRVMARLPMSKDVCSSQNLALASFH